MKKVLLVLLIIGIVACDRAIRPKDTVVIKPDPVIPIDTTAPWPIKVVSVERNVDKNIPFKWEIVTENGVMYYTNTKPSIGQVAFYLGIDDKIKN